MYNNFGFKILLPCQKEIVISFYLDPLKQQSAGGGLYWKYIGCIWDKDSGLLWMFPFNQSRTHWAIDFHGQQILVSARPPLGLPLEARSARRSRRSRPSPAMDSSNGCLTDHWVGLRGTLEESIVFRKKYTRVSCNWFLQCTQDLVFSL